TGDPYAPTRPRPPARYAGPPHPQDPLLGPDARARRAPMDRADDPRAAPDRGRRALPRPPPHGAQGMARRRVGAHGEQPQGEVLPAHAGRAARARGGRVPVVALRGSHAARALGAGGPMSRHEGEWPGPRRAFRLPLGRRGVAKDVDAELHFHIDERIEELVGRGLSREQAEAEVRERFGDVERIGAELRAIDRGTERRRAYGEWLGDLRRDVRYAVRGMVARPLVATVIVITLALGIGANTAIFSVVYSVLLRPLPYAHAD